MNCKKHPEILRSVIFYILGALLVYAIYRISYEKPHYIQENKTINLNDYLRNVE